MTRFNRWIHILIYAFLVGATIVACRPFKCHATFTEQFAISAEAISLANTATADPPGLMAIHYNPAGLSNLPEGATFDQNFTIPFLVVESKFKTDPDFEGFMDTFGPQEGQIHDPVADTEDANSSGVMYLPIYDDTINFLIGPTAGISAREPGSPWTFAIGNYAPFAGGLNHKSDSPANYGVRTLYQQHLIYASPAVSYQLTPKVSVGLSVGMGQTAMGARIKMRSPNELVALTRVLGDATEGLEIPVISELTLPPPWFGGGLSPYDRAASLDFQIRDDFSPNYNLGFLWEPNEWFSYGAVYQSEINVKASGGYTFKFSEEWQRMMAWQGSSPLTIIISGMLQLPHQGIPYQTGRMTSEFSFPRRIQTGIKLNPTKRLKLLFDLHWADWSVVETHHFKFDQDIQLLQMLKLMGYPEGHRDLVVQRQFEDTLHWSAGLEYQLTDKLALRFGYEKRPTSVQDRLFDLQTFVPDLDFYGAGIGLSLPNHHQIDLGFGYLVNPSYKVPNDSSSNLNSTDFTDPVYNPYAGLDYEQETAIYMVSLGMRMPFHDFIEMQKELMHHQHEMIHHLIGILNPFSSESEHNSEDSAAE